MTFNPTTKMALPVPFFQPEARPKSGHSAVALEVSELFSATEWNDTLLVGAGIDQKTVATLNGIHIYTCKHLWQMFQDIINNGNVGNNPTNEMKVLAEKLSTQELEQPPWNATVPPQPPTCYLCNLPIWTTDMANQTAPRTGDIQELAIDIGSLQGEATQAGLDLGAINGMIAQHPHASPPTYLYCWAINNWVNKLRNQIKNYRNAKKESVKAAALKKIQQYLGPGRSNRSEMEKDFAHSPCYLEAEHVVHYLRALYAGILSTNPNPLQRAISAFNDFERAIQVAHSPINNLDDAISVAMTVTVTDTNITNAIGTLQTDTDNSNAIQTLDTQFYKQRFLSRAYIAKAWLNEYKPSHKCCNQYKNQGDFLNWNLNGSNGFYNADTPNINAFYKDLMSIDGTPNNNAEWVKHFTGKDGPWEMRQLLEPIPPPQSAADEYNNAKNQTEKTVNNIVVLLNYSENTNAEYYKTTLFIYVLQKFLFTQPTAETVAAAAAGAAVAAPVIADAIATIVDGNPSDATVIAQAVNTATVTAIPIVRATAVQAVLPADGITAPTAAAAAAIGTILEVPTNDQGSESSFPQKSSALDLGGRKRGREEEVRSNNMFGLGDIPGQQYVPEAKRRLAPREPTIREADNELEGYTIIDNLDNDKYRNIYKLCDIFFKLLRKAVQGLAPDSERLIITLHNLIVTYSEASHPQRVQRGLAFPDRPTRARNPPPDVVANRQAIEQMEAEAEAAAAAAAAAKAAKAQAAIESSKTRKIIANKINKREFLTCDIALRILNDVLKEGAQQPEDLSSWQLSNFPSRTADLSNFKFSSMPNGSTYVTQK